MGHVCCHDDFPGPKNEHPIVAVIAILAILAAILLITWAKLEVHGTGEIEAALAEQPLTQEAGDEARDAAVTSSRFATGFSP